MDLQLSGKRALVSGSTAGIGFAIAEALAREGASVAGNGRTDARFDQAVWEKKAAVPGVGVEGLAVDLATAPGAAEATRRFPDIDILVNNLGIFEPKAFEEIPDEDWFRFFDANVM